MLTVPQAAKRVRRDPETVRRWIRSGKLPSRKVGTQYVIEESELERFLPEPPPLPVPPEWETDDSGNPQPDWGELVRRSREGR